jgi:hypothetical protein
MFVAGFCICLGAHAGTVSFATQQSFATGPAPYSVAIADINGDGKPDVITANYNVTAGGAAVLLNTTSLNASTPTFDAWQGFTTLLSSTCVTTADINTDGKPDLIVAEKSYGVVSVLLNTTAAGASTSSFSTTQSFAVGRSGMEQTVAVTTADINGDGKPDMITANFAIGTISVFINTTVNAATTPTFAASVDFPTGTGTTNTMPRSIASADINGDGKPDLIVANRGDNTVSVFLNTTVTNGPTPTFTTQQPFATGSNPTSVVADDLNGDGKLDLIVANLFDNTISVLLNTTTNGVGIASFASQKTFAAGVGTQSAFAAATADLNGDGKPDVIVAERADNLVSVLVNTTATNATTPSFSAEQTFATGLLPLSVTAADVNGDGKLDLIVANLSGSTVSVLLNTTAPDRIFADGFQ